MPYLPSHTRKAQHLLLLLRIPAPSQRPALSLPANLPCTHTHNLHRRPPKLVASLSCYHICSLTSTPCACALLRFPPIYYHNTHRHAPGKACCLPGLHMLPNRTSMACMQASPGSTQTELIVLYPAAATQSAQQQHPGHLAEELASAPRFEQYQQTGCM
jgi:hypothetical protein